MISSEDNGKEVSRDRQTDRYTDIHIDREMCLHVYVRVTIFVTVLVTVKVLVLTKLEVSFLSDQSPVLSLFCIVCVRRLICNYCPFYLLRNPHLQRYQNTRIIKRDYLFYSHLQQTHHTESNCVKIMTILVENSKQAYFSHSIPSVPCGHFPPFTSYSIVRSLRIQG